MRSVRLPGSHAAFFIIADELLETAAASTETANKAIELRNSVIMTRPERAAARPIFLRGGILSSRIFFLDIRLSLSSLR